MVFIGIRLLLSSWAGDLRSSLKDNKTYNWSQNEFIMNHFKFYCSVSKPSHIVFLSSAGAIYDQTKKIFSKKSEDPSPSSPYGEKKLICEENFL